MQDDKSFTLALSWIIGTGAALWICYMIGLALGVTRAEAPAWAQAVGAGGAIYGAFRIASGEQKAKREDALNRARVIAFTMQPRVFTVSVTLANVVGELENIANFDGPLSKFELCYQEVNGMPRFSASEIIDLVPLPNISFLLARASSSIEMMLVTTMGILRHPDMLISAEFRRVQATGIVTNLQIAKQALNDIIIDLQVQGPELGKRASSPR